MCQTAFQMTQENPNLLNSSRMNIAVEEEMVYSLHLYGSVRIHFVILEAITALYTHLIYPIWEAMFSLLFQNVKEMQTFIIHYIFTQCSDITSCQIYKLVDNIMNWHYCPFKIYSKLTISLIFQKRKKYQFILQLIFHDEDDVVEMWCALSHIV